MLAFFISHSGRAHISYFGRDFGSFTGLNSETVTIAGQTVEANFGWADGADADWTSVHYQTYFRFTLQKASDVTLAVTSADPAHFLPGYSIYSGLAQTSPPDNDEDAQITIDYLISLGSPAREGAFNALHTWKVGGDDDATFADMSTLTYATHAVDGTPAEFGSAIDRGVADEIWSDGVADGTVTRTFTLPAGTYTVVVGGASYYQQVDDTYHAFSTTLTVEPSTDGGDGGSGGDGGNNGSGGSGGNVSTSLPAPPTSLAELVYSFPVPAAGPLGELLQANDGSFYGTTSTGGASGAGTIFQMAADGAFRTLAEFTGYVGARSGAQPSARLTLGADGNYYGVNAQGGANGFGTIFKMLPNGTTTTLITFTGTTGNFRGTAPFAALVAGGDGYLYGTTTKGGQSDRGTIFKLSEATGAFTTLIEFTGKAGAAKGAAPYAALTRGSNGLFYGSTSTGGKGNFGTIFSLSTAGVLTTLVEFTDLGAKNKGSAPYAALTQAADGNFYGTTARGGAGDYGTLFRVTPEGGLKTLAQFTGKAGADRGAQPEAPLVIGPDGSLYGTTLNGGRFSAGTVFKATLEGKLITLVEFTNAGTQKRGASPQAGLTVGHDGFFYGATLRGGAGDAGTIFRMKSTGEITTLLEFGGVDPATYSQAGIVRSTNNNFYGVTPATGLLGQGALFRITPSGAANTLVEFTGSGAVNAGSQPDAPLLQAQDGTFYGVTQRGGAYNLGTIFKVTASGELTTLVDFTNSGATNKGAQPRAALLQTGPDDFYGVTSAGGFNNAGTVFHLTANGTLTTLVEFTGNGAANKGAFAAAPLILGSDGKLYGTTARGGAHAYGTIFSLTTAGTLTTLIEFADAPGAKGAFPEAPLIQAADGNFYGVTSSGGATGDGTIFRLTPAGALTTLMEFSGRGGKILGTGPIGLFQASDEQFYGLTSFGGKANYGTVFRLSRNGIFTTLAELNYAKGAYPQASFVPGSDGNLYTTAALGGAFGAGTVFRLRLRAGADFIESFGVAADEAQLRARFERGSLPATVYFQYGVTSYDQQTPAQAVAAGTGPLYLTASLSGLLPNTTYYFREVVVDSSGTVYGHDQTFTTRPAVTEVISTGGGVTGEPNSTVVTKLGIPAIADNQAVAVLANLKTETGNQVAILAGNPPTVVVRKGDPAPVLVPQTAATFAAFDDPVCDADGQIAFTARVLIGGKTASGLWTNLHGPLTEVVHVGGDAPTLPTGTKLTALTSYVFSQGGVIFFTGTLAGGGTLPSDNMAVWAFDHGGYHMLLRKGGAVDGLKIISIAALSPAAGSTGQGRGYYDKTLAVRVTLSDGSQALLQLTPGGEPGVIGPTPFALSAAPDANVVASVNPPSVSSGGTGAFLGILQGGKPTVVAVAADSSFNQLAEVGDAAPGTTGAFFAKLADPISDGAQTAFLGNLTGPGVASGNQGGVWWEGGTGLGLVARTGYDVPSVAAAKWSSFVSLILPGQTGPVFLAKLAPKSLDRRLPSDVKPTTNLGLFALDADRNRRLLVRTGSTIDIRGTPKTLSLITIFGAIPSSPGQGRNYNTTGDLVFRATFTDRTQAILRTHLP